MDKEFNMEKDKTRKASLILAAMKRDCTMTTSENKIFRAFADALYKGRKVDIENLAGGITNYTYKLSLPSNERLSSCPKSTGNEKNEGETYLFAKISFPRALWNPDVDFHYDLERTENEYTMMKYFNRLAPGCVPEPFICADVHDMKVSVSQFCPGDVLFCQHIEGAVDMRVAKELPMAIAKLHLSDLEEDFNTKARDCMISIFPLLESHILGYFEEGRAEVASRAASLAREYGQALCREIFEKCTEGYRARDIPCHGDLHSANILVTPHEEKGVDNEAREDDSNANSDFRIGTNSSFVVCDWEMAMVGPLGLDQGNFYALPIACLLAHTINGAARVSSRLTQDIIRFVELYWESYASAMKELGGKDGTFFQRSYRNGLGWTGWKLYTLSAMGWVLDFMPIDHGNKSDVDLFQDGLLVIGMKLMRWGFCNHEPDLDLEQLQHRFVGMLKEELSFVESNSMHFETRRSSEGGGVSECFLAPTAIAPEKRCSMDMMMPNRESSFQKRCSLELDIHTPSL